MYGEAVRAGRIPQEVGEMDLRLLSDRCEQTSPCGCCYSVCLFAWYSTHYLSYISGIVHLQNVNKLFLWTYIPRLCTMFVRMKLYLQFSFRTCCVSQGHITTCYCSTDVLVLSVVDPFLSPLPHTQFKEHEANLSSPQAGICRIFSGFISFCLPVRFLTERLARGFDHWQQCLRFHWGGYWLRSWRMEKRSERPTEGYGEKWSNGQQREGAWSIVMWKSRIEGR